MIKEEREKGTYNEEVLELKNTFETVQKLSLKKMMNPSMWLRTKVFCYRILKYIV